MLCLVDTFHIPNSYNSLFFPITPCVASYKLYKMYVLNCIKKSSHLVKLVGPETYKLLCMALNESNVVMIS